jgi:hypothetical protein
MDPHGSFRAAERGVAQGLHSVFIETYHSIKLGVDWNLIELNFVIGK